MILAWASPFNTYFDALGFGFLLKLCSELHLVQIYLFSFSSESYKNSHIKSLILIGIWKLFRSSLLVKENLGLLFIQCVWNVTLNQKSEQQYANAWIMML